MVTIALLPMHCAQNSPNNLCAQEKDAKGVIFGVLVQIRGCGRALHIAFLKDPFSLKSLAIIQSTGTFPPFEYFYTTLSDF